MLRSPDVGWQDFPVDRQLIGRGVTITEAHVVQWASVTGDWYPLHIDAEFAKTSIFGARVAHGPLTFALAVGLIAQTGEYGEAILAWLGANSISVQAPVYIGDTLSVEATVTASRAASSPDRGVVTLQYVARNQRSETLMSFDFTLLMRSRQRSAPNSSQEDRG
jgi:itaconyl-CoA hydratase